MTVITSLELNSSLIEELRPLFVAGLMHSAFVLGYEAGLSTMTVDGNHAPPAALVSFIQKGLQYLELEANVNADGTDAGGAFILLTQLELITKNVDELRQLVKERREKAGALMVDTATNRGPSKMRDKEETKAAKSGKEKEMRGKEKTKATKARKSTKAGKSGTKRGCNEM